MKKRIISLFLAWTLLLPALSSCSDNGAENEPAQTDPVPTPAAEEAPVEPEETELSDNLPEADFEGYGFHVGAQDGIYYGCAMIGQVLVEEMNGDVVNDYGILPMPKLNERQKDYISGSTDRPYAVPVTAQNDERLGIIIEAMSAEGYKQVRPAFFEIALKSKYTFDADSAEMLEIIGNTIVRDFSYIYSNFGGFAWTLMNMMSVNNPTKDFASYYAKNERGQQKTLEKLQKKLNELKNP